MDSLPLSLSALTIDRHTPQPFRFFDLPLELRRKILDLIFCLGVGRTIDIDVKAVRLRALFPVSRQFRAETIASFFGSNTFRLLPTHGARNAQPLIKSFPSHCRANLVFLELRLGPFWQDPPKSWVIDDSLGLEEAVSVRVLKVFIEVDPAHEVFNGFRRAKGFYTEYSGNLLEGAIRRLPNVARIEIDGWPSVTRDSPLVNKMAQVALENGIKYTWGPGQVNKSTDISRTRSVDQGMVPFYSSSPFHRYTYGEEHLL